MPVFILGLILIDISAFLFIFFEISLITSISSKDSQFKYDISFCNAKCISSSDLPTPANTISLGKKPTSIALFISFELTASIPIPYNLISCNNFLFEFDFKAI